MDKIFAAIRKIWNLASTVLLIGIVTIIALFFVTIFFPDQVIQAFGIMKNVLGV